MYLIITAMSRILVCICSINTFRLVTILENSENQSNKITLYFKEIYGTADPEYI